MANETSYAALLAAGGAVARILSTRLHQNLYDPTSIRRLFSFVPFVGGASATQNITKVTRGYVASAATNETTGGGSRQVLSTGNYDLTVARYYAKMAPTDLLHIVGGPLDVDYLLGVLTETLDLTLTDMLTDAFQNIAGSVGTSGVNLTTDDWYDAIFYLNLQNNPRELAAVLHNQQVNDLVESVRGETGASVHRPDTQAILEAKGVGYVGTWAGVDIYQSDSVELDGGSANRVGAMFSEGVIAYQLAPVSRMLDGMMINAADILAATEEMFVERDRDADNGVSDMLVNFYPAVAEQEDLRGVRIVTDA